MDPTTISIIVLAITAAGLVKGVFGVGFPTAAIAFSAIVIDARLAILLVGLPIIATNTVQVFFGMDPRLIIRKYWRILALAMPLGGGIGYYSDGVPLKALTFFLGLMIVAFAIISLARWAPPIPAKHDAKAQWVTSGVSGVVAGLTLLWAPPMMIYLISRQVDRKEWIGVLGLTLCVGSLPVIFGYMANGTLRGETLWFGLFLCIPAVAAQLGGEIIARRIQPERFRRYLLIMFLVLGLSLLARAVLS